MNRFEMFAAMVQGRIVTLSKASGQTYTGRVVSMMLEDGSGFNFIIKMSTSLGKTEEFFYRTTA